MIRLCALGPVQLTGSGDEELLSVLAQPKRLALLVYLAAADPPGFHRRDELLPLFWPERDVDRARASLRKALHHLRKALGADALPGRGDEVEVDPGVVWSDVRAFREAAVDGRHLEALELYRGDLLEAFHIDGCLEYESWLERARAGLRRGAASAALQAAEWEAEEGRSGRASELARQAVGLSPFDETLHRRVLQILDRIGDHAGALRLHQSFADRMAEELEATPAPETEALAKAIRRRRDVDNKAGSAGGLPPPAALVSPDLPPTYLPEDALATPAQDLARVDVEGPDERDRPVAGRLDREHAKTTAPAQSLRSASFLRSRVGLALLVTVLGVVGTSGWALWRSARQRWASSEALPRIQRLIDERRIVAAQRLAREAEPFLAGNPEFQRLWRQSLSPIPLSIRTTPPGARVSVTDYRNPEGPWQSLGISPLERARAPAGVLRLKVEMAGFQTIEAQFRGEERAAGQGGRVAELSFELQPLDGRPEMIRVSKQGPLQRSPVTSPQELEEYLLDRYEVTNRDFAEFLAAGGYTDRRFWTEPIVVDGRSVQWEQAMTAFVDRTGRPGPATWELGSFPPDAAELPVGGVSWYEAAAYCRYVHKMLPTIHHWYKAAGLGGIADLLAFSNLDGDGPAAVGSFRGVGPFGHFDMAGNVREWVVNPVRGQRYILGGAWSDPGYMFSLPDATSPLDRSPKNGLRCASYREEAAPILGAEVHLASRKYDVEPIDDALFDTYRALYAYDPLPLEPRPESVEDALPHWRREVVSLRAPYGADRITVHLFLPRSVDPPYQAVVYYPGAAAFNIESIDEMETMWFDFIVRTGRAVVHPVYEGTYGRKASNLLRERVTHWAMDIGRSIDYLETRDDIDVTKLAYYGFSTGAWRGPIFTATEPRFRTSVLFAGGAVPDDWWPPEVHPTNFAPHADVPVLMVNGENDFFFPVETSQRPLFELLGAPESDKRHLIVEGGHMTSDWQAVMGAILDWLDRYLGPVK